MARVGASCQFSGPALRRPSSSIFTSAERFTAASAEAAAQALAEELEIEASGRGDPRRDRTIELELTRKDLRDPDGRPIGIVSVARDITERQRTERGELPRGDEWRAMIEKTPKRERHLHTHRGDRTFPNELDRKVLTGDVIRRYTFTGEAPVLRERMGQLAARGVTEIAFQPAGPDIPRELTAFARMAGLTG
jgi:hypothetical protein